MADPDLRFELDELQERHEALLDAHDGLLAEAALLRLQVRSDDRFFADLPEAPPSDWRRLAVAVHKFLVYRAKREKALREARLAEIDDALLAYTQQMDEHLSALLER